MARKRSGCRANVYFTESEYVRVINDKNESGSPSTSAYIRNVMCEKYPKTVERAGEYLDKNVQLADNIHELSKEKEGLEKELKEVQAKVTGLTEAQQHYIDEAEERDAWITDLKDRNEMLFIACRTIQTMNVFKMIWYRLTQWKHPIVEKVIDNKGGTDIK